MGENNLIYDVKEKINIEMIVYLFLFMFAPPILPGNLVFYLAILSSIILLKCYKKELINALKISGIKNFTILIYMYLFYSGIIAISSFIWGENESFNSYITPVYQLILITPIMMICIIHIILWCKKKGFELDILLEHFILAGTIEAIIVLITFISPEIRQICIKIMGQEWSSNEYMNFILEKRYFGLANGLYDLFGWGTGLLASLPIFLSKEKRKKYIWLVPLLLISPLLNSRTGILMFLGAMLCYLLFFNNESAFYFVKKILYLIVSILFICFLLIWIKKYNYSVFEWILSGIDFLRMALTDSQNSDLFRTASVPQFPVIIFGTGHDIYFLKYGSSYISSDVGYINYLYISGIVGSIILYSIFISFFIKSIKKSRIKRQRWLLIFFMFSTFIFNFKARPFTHCSATALILTVLFYSLYNEYKRNL